MPSKYDENYEEDRTTHRLANPNDGPMTKDSFTSAVNAVDRALRDPNVYQSTYPNGNKIADEAGEQLHKTKQPEPVDPFDDPVALAQLQFITSMRIYDVLFALLDETNSEKAEFIADLHRSGGLLMSSPRFTAHFVDDEATKES